jgi:VIT1/CCC1 family predicted Fe2+/Mn2+ transporter
MVAGLCGTALMSIAGAGWISALPFALGVLWPTVMVASICAVFVAWLAACMLIAILALAVAGVYINMAWLFSAKLWRADP